jgi:hypothetical protein
VTDSRRIAERAALFGIPCQLVTDREASSAGWDVRGLPARPRPFGFGSLKDGGAPGRLADAIIANFARVVPGTP